MNKFDIIPKVGDIRSGGELGYEGGKRNKWIYHACVDCGKERWTLFVHKTPQSLRCRHCGFIYHKRRYDLKYKLAYGYVGIRIPPDDPYYCMADPNTGYIKEHRYVMAHKLNRPLATTEQVHHVNGVKDDNRPENLTLIDRRSHRLREMFCSKCGIKMEIRLLRLQIKNLQEQLQGVLNI